MYKPASLRAHLLGQVPGLGPDHLHTFVESGHIVSTAGASQSFEYHYTLQVLLTDYAGHSDAVIIPVLAWLRQHQPELFLSRDLIADSVTFEADVLSHDTYDFGLKLKLSERVTVTQDGNTARVTHHNEPPLDPYEDVKSWELHVRGEKVAQWTT